MSQRSRSSARYEYELYVDREVEAYKNSVSQAHLGRIVDRAHDALESELQIGLRNVLLAAEVNRHIAKRLAIPSFQTWHRRRRKNATEPRRPECWGLRSDTPLALAINPALSHAQLLVSGSRVESSALYLAANGCQVMAVEPEADMVERVLTAAAAAGFGPRVRGLAAELIDFHPDEPLAAVICTPAAFAGLAVFEREHVIALLQTATANGGVHMVETIVDGQEAVCEDELRAWYSGWNVSFVREPGVARAFVATKRQ